MNVNFTTAFDAYDMASASFLIECEDKLIAKFGNDNQNDPIIKVLDASQASVRSALSKASEMSDNANGFSIIGAILIAQKMQWLGSQANEILTAKGWSGEGLEAFHAILAQSLAEPLNAFCAELDSSNEVPVGEMLLLKSEQLAGR